MWVPVFLYDFDEFLEFVVDHVDSENPLGRLARETLNNRSNGPGACEPVRYIYH
ncbi:MAG: hypothetical protein JWM11_809 [Planctomycetaceae bacterium]|nr:hypothetical protein [Planctomycetaceae bacterium]